ELEAALTFRLQRGADILELLPQAGVRRALGLEVVPGLLELAPQRLGVGLERRRLFALFLQRLLELLVLLTRAGEGGAFVLQRLSRLLDFGLQTRNRFALARQRTFQILGLAASRAGRLAFVLERCAKAIELRSQLRGAFAFGVERGRGALEVAAQPAGDRFAFRDPRALLREGVLQLPDP